MNFFQRQREVRRLSARLVILFAIAVVGIIATVDLAVVLAWGGFNQPADSLLGVVAVTSVVVGLVIGLASLVRSVSLRSGGGGQVARSLGGVPVPEDTTDPQLRRLRNVVEEVAIASGVPVPELYVLEHEPGINAFAAGWSTSDAAIAVTRGALERLNRDELQGVVAHEFSHVVNGDMRLNIRLIGLLFGILVLAIAGRMALYSGAGRGRNRNAAPLMVVALALVVAGSVGVFVGRLIKAAVSRQREYLADASAVQFTRQTEGLTGALKKIGGLPTGSTLRNPRAEDVSHMLFGSGKGLAGMFATHPPLLKRIQALDPRITQQELDQLARRWSEAPPSGLAEDRARGLAGPATAAAPATDGGRAAEGTGAGRREPAGPPAGQASLPAADTSVAMPPDRVAAEVGTPGAAAFQHAGAILEQIPEPLRERAHRPETALPLVFGLLLSSDPPMRANQHAQLVARHGQALADAAWREGEAVSTLHPMLRLPLAELAFPALRHRPRPEQDAVTATVHALIQADGQLTVSEYCLSRLMHASLYEAVHRQPPWGRRRYSLAASRSAATVLLAVLAQAGHSDRAAASAAFQAGAGHLFPGQRLAYAPPEGGVVALEAAWPPLDGLNPGDKELLVRAMVTVIGHDGRMTVAELELLRTICAMLHCPLPPLVGLDHPAGAPVPGPAGPGRGAADRRGRTGPGRS